jgi:hypothetical protein
MELFVLVLRFVTVVLRTDSEKSYATERKSIQKTENEKRSMNKILKVALEAYFIFLF